MGELGLGGEFTNGRSVFVPIVDSDDRESRFSVLLLQPGQVRSLLTTGSSAIAPEAQQGYLAGGLFAEADLFALEVGQGEVGRFFPKDLRQHLAGIIGFKGLDKALVLGSRGSCNRRSGGAVMELADLISQWTGLR